ncbi:MAG: hypothetical protein HYS59_01930 [Candidatus Vogelbacteria bacterium]|nr:hypothetical protein [Candidatus Vogelbacteria bacterium]
MRTAGQKIAILCLVTFAVLSVLGGTAALAPVAYAQSEQPIVPCVYNCTFNDLIRKGGLADRVLQFFVTFAVVVGTLSFGVAGVLFITSAGNESQRSDAKDIMKNTVIGIALAAAAYIIVRFILFALTGGSVEI